MAGHSGYKGGMASLQTDIRSPGFELRSRNARRLSYGLCYLRRTSTRMQVALDLCGFSGINAHGG